MGSVSLAAVFEGWEGYNTSLIHAVEGLIPEVLRIQPVPDMRSIGQVAAHIALGRIDWFSRMDAPGSVELVEERNSWRDPRGSKATEESVGADAEHIVLWLNRTWWMVNRTLNEWTVDDLPKWYPHTYYGETYAVSRQWTLWRIMAHDIHHGGQLSTLLALVGRQPDELTGLGGHLTYPPLVSEM